MTIRLANLAGRAVLLAGERHLDVEKASKGRLPSDPMAALRQWDELREWGAGLGTDRFDAALDERRLGPPVPRPTKIFAVGLNYREHAKEANLAPPGQPMIFTKFQNCVTGPRADVPLTSAFVDWEVELVVVIGRGGRRIAEANALDHVAGYCIGQDISDRKLQFSDQPPQFSMGKSADGFGPIGPAVVSLDGLRDPNDLELTCDVAGERMQTCRTSDMIFGVPAVVEFLSRYCTLEPGDIIFTGTPGGVGSVRNPRRYLRAGEVITSRIEGLGELSNRCVEG